MLLLVGTLSGVYGRPFQQESQPIEVEVTDDSGKFEIGIYPKSPTMLAMAKGEQLFYGLYFTMTGLHALHVIIGGVAIILVMVLIGVQRIRPDRALCLENVGLYWHLVDVVWIFLFPLFYLIG